MRRIAGTFMMLAAFSGGCNLPQSQVAQNDRAGMYTSGPMAASASAWPRNTPSQMTAESALDGPGFRSGAIGMVAMQQPAPTAPSPVQVAAKPPVPDVPPGFPTPVSPSTAPLPAVAELANPGPAVQTSFTPPIDPALKDVEFTGDEAAIKMAKHDAVPPARMPEIVVAPPLPVKMPEIVLEPKMAPVSIAIDTMSSPPGAPALRLVNTKRFTLSYAVQDSGSGATSVDLWETRDSKTWKKCENAQAHQGAYHVEVRDEGVFGYTMVARPQGDKGNTQPKAGDVPQVWVTVDATKPTVSLTAVELNLTSKAPDLIIRWSAKDKNFGPRPVTLSYAEHVEGPWLPLATNIENTGRYECAIPANLPKRALLRVEAVDLVGNSGVAQTAKAVRLDFTPPVANLLPPPPHAPQATITEAPRPVVIICNVESTDSTKE